MRVILLSRYTRKGASSRLRTLQFVSNMSKKGIDIEVFPFFDDKHLEGQYKNGKTSFLNITKYLYKRLKCLMMNPKPDLIWLEYEALPWIPWFIERLFFPRGVPIISDYDDAIFHRYDNHRYKIVRALLGSKIKAIMKISSLVVAGNDYLYEYANQSGSKNIQLVPTVINLNTYKTTSLKKNNDKVRLGWIGTPTTFRNYLKDKLPLFKNLADSEGFKISLMSAWSKTKKIDSSIDFLEWSEKSEVSFLHSLDIGIMPLNNSPWAQGKCGYKLLQYMACGLPVVASPIGVNSQIVEHGVNGFLADSDEEWRIAIKLLINDSDLRKRMGAKGLKKVEEYFSLKLWEPKLSKMFLSVNNNTKSKIKTSNVESKTILSFGDEWKHFNQKKLIGKEYLYLFDKYFNIFPWDSLPTNAIGYDMGCGSGRWAMLVAPKIGKLNCIDPSVEAINVAKKNLAHLHNIEFLNSSVLDEPLPQNSQDFGYCLGVLHHIKNTDLALKECVNMLKPGAPLLIYLYYKFDNRPNWYYLVWKLTDILRRVISKCPSNLKLIITNFIAIVIYYPLARLSLIFEKLGFNVDTFLLSGYRRTSFYTMQTDSRDRFGTPLEKRFTRHEVLTLMQKAGLEHIKFSKEYPFWCAIGKKKTIQ